MADRLGARPFVVLAAGMALAGCINFSSLDNLDAAAPPSDAFSLALYKNYTFLAHSFGDLGQASYGSFDQDASIPLTRTELSVAALANAFAQKAVALTKGQLVDPEPSRDIKTHELRDRLIRALTPGRDSYPRDAARAQADWDCWRLNERNSTQLAAAEACHRSFDVTLPRLETEVAAVEKAAADKAAAEKKAAESAAGAAPGQPPAQSDQAGAPGAGETP